MSTSELTSRSQPDSSVSFRGRVPWPLFKRFGALFPQQGSVQWFIETMLTRFVERMEREPSAVAQIDRAIEEYLALRRGARPDQLPPPPSAT